MSSASPAASKAVSNLAKTLSREAQCLTDPASSPFKESMKRWSDLGIQIPSAIFTPACEDDVLKIVEYSVHNGIPFVAKAGGCSPWSTIGSEGWIIDLFSLSGIKLDLEKETATIQGGSITRQVNEKVAEAAFCITSPAFSGVGYIPFLLGGGNSWLIGIHGMAVDNLISARVVTAAKGLVIASETENADLFWGLKGAGQFFGLVTEVTIKIFPVPREITSWTCIFAPSQITEVASAVEKVANSGDTALSPGMAAIAAAPGGNKPAIIVNTMHFRPEKEAEEILAPILAAKPMQQIRKNIKFANITDTTDAMNAKSGFKSQISCGLQTFKASQFERALHNWTKLVEECPSASGSLFAFNWTGIEAMQKSC